MILAAVALGKNPTIDQMKTGLAGNLCRCTGYSAIYRSIEAATKRKNRGERKDRKDSLDLVSGRQNRGVRKERRGRRL
jgi:xanthine dehydrogenase iron-sulfur cluster and FAD-binding subunit A